MAEPPGSGGDNSSRLSAPGAEARQIVEGLVADFDAAGNVVGLDIDHASRKLDLSKVETIALPPVSAAE